MDIMTLTITSVIYLAITVYLGYYGYKKTKNSLDYLVAGRNIHPFIMALSYGATFISTSAIVGFGGVAALYGMGLLWLTFLNIFVGIFIAFICFGKRTRHIGHNLDVHTFPELIGRRFQSPFMQSFSGLIIFSAMPLYAAAVLIGAARFLEATFHMDYNVALLVYTLIVCAYVFAGGMKAVMYTDAFQAIIMTIGMLLLLIFTYVKLGGVTAAHQALASIGNLVPEKFVKMGHLGWTNMPAFGSEIWWTLVSTIVMGVGVGVLTQPQLAVRFMTVKSNKELNRAVMVGGIFILLMTGVAFTVGALSNAYFVNNPQFGKISIAVAEGNIDKIIPLYVNSAMPHWFVYIFMLTLLAAAMSTSSSQFHSMGTSFGRDFIERTFFKGQKSSLGMTRLGIVISVIITVVLGYKLPISVIAVSTAIFFGMCASIFLPVFIGTLYFKWMTKTGAICSMLVGLFGSAGWMLFVHLKESNAIGFCKFVFSKPSVASFPWTVVDQLFVILPLSFLTAIIVSLLTKKPDQTHLNNCFKHI
ncbi:MAG: sodium:solute symporter family protein [Candidatus Omnitrophica bacterium]|nr:sodium:solute symporter family protein [Candidatus Omnitrophota bacterium]